MRDESDTHPTVMREPCKKLSHGRSCGRIKLCRRLVEDKVMWVHGKDTRQSNTLLLSTRQLGSRAPDVSTHPHQLKSMANAMLDFRLDKTEITRTKGNVIKNESGHNLISRILPKAPDERANCQPLQIIDGRIVAVCDYAPFVNKLRRAHDPSQRGLSAPVVPHKSHKLTRSKSE